MGRSPIKSPRPVPRLIPSVVNADPAVLARESTSHADAILRQGDQIESASSAASAASATALLTASALSYVNARTDLGARGDGSSDDTARIQAALNAAETTSAVVYLPRGTYVISDTLFVPNKVVLTGIGRADAGLLASATFPTDGRPMVRLGRALDSLVFGCRVERMSLDGGGRAKVCVFSSAANEQSGARFVVASNFTQYGIHFNAASIITVENVEVYPVAAGATNGIYLQNCAGDNMVRRATIGVSGSLAAGLYVQSSQCLAESIHVETCTVGVNLDAATAVLIGVSGPTVNPDVGDLVLAQGNTRFNVGLNLTKNSSVRLLTDNFFGYVLTDPFLPLWIGGDSFSAGSLRGPRTHTTPPGSGTHVQGEIVYNADPIAGGFIGWVCTTGGSPGTWKSWGAISP